MRDGYCLTKRSLSLPRFGDSSIPFGLEEHQCSGLGTNQSNTYYYFLAGHLLGSLDSNGTQFYLSDAQGSLVSSFTNAAGGATMKSNQLFGPYGNNRYNAGSLNTAKGFIGQYNDGTGLDYFNARYYDPIVGVFLSADTVQGNAQGDNPYGYVGGNPETRSDPSGRYVVGAGGQRYYPGVPNSSSVSTGNSAPTGSSVPPKSPAPTESLPSVRGIGGAVSGGSRERNVAYGLYFSIAAWRQFTGDWDMADFAAAEWYLTDQNGNGNCTFCADGFLGYHGIGQITKSSGRDEINDPTHTSDAEQQLLAGWLTNGGAQFAVLASKIARMANVHAILHIVLFTELPPCGQCQAFFNDVFLPAMSAIATAWMNGPPAIDPWPSGEIAIQFDVFAKDPAVTGGDWRQPINSPAALLNPVHEVIPFVYASPDGTA